VTRVLAGTGTGTGVGKTVVTAGFLAAATGGLAECLGGTRPDH
jgi:dethiobiotin synthetase